MKYLLDIAHNSPSWFYNDDDEDDDHCYYDESLMFTDCTGVLKSP
jgi:hypothetical protein